MYSYEKVLPVGSIVLLKDAKLRVMIFGYQVLSTDSSDKTIYDYCGCSYPYGFMSLEKTVLFNHDMIDRVVFIGLQSDKYDKQADRIREIVAERTEEE